MGPSVTGSFAVVTGSQAAAEALAELTAAARLLQAYLLSPDAPHPALLADIGQRLAEGTEAVETHDVAWNEVFGAGMRHQAAVHAGGRRRLRAV